MSIKKSVLFSVILFFIISTLSARSPKSSKKSMLTEVKELSIVNGSIDIDPSTVNYIDIKFNMPMDQNYSNYMCYFYSGVDVQDNRWINSSTYRIFLDLHYDSEYKFVINDYEAVNDPSYNYSQEKSFFRNKKGKYCEQFIIQFKTKKSQNTHPMTHRLEFNKVVDLQDNNKYNPGTQQALVKLTKFLNYENVLTGDTVEIPYKIRSTYNLKNIMVNVVDASAAVTDYWKPLSDEQIFIDELNAGKIKEGVLIFPITHDMVKTLNLQIMTTYDDNPLTVSISFLNK